MNLGSLLLPSLAVALLSATTAIAVPIPDDCFTNGFALGCQSWTFKNFTTMEAIDKTAAAGGKVIEFETSQLLSADKPGVVFDYNSPDDVIALVLVHLKEKGVRAVNYGVVDIPVDEAGARKIFEFAKKMGLYGITTESVGSIDTIEKLVKEYDIRVGFHDHPKQPNNPGYRNWDPNYILSVIKGRDPRIGATADIGHWVRSGLVPVDCLKILRGHIMNVHMKDLNEKSPDAHDVPWGQGVSDVPAVLDELQRQHFVGNLDVEYEYNWDNNVTDVAQCFGFVRGYETGKSAVNK
jgi:sugar phosphate isomerase/epimerase